MSRSKILELSKKFMLGEELFMRGSDLDNQEKEFLTLMAEKMTVFS
jgi:hypothetical protein